MKKTTKAKKATSGKKQKPTVVQAESVWVPPELSDAIAPEALYSAASDLLYYDPDRWEKHADALVKTATAQSKVRALAASARTERKKCVECQHLVSNPSTPMEHGFYCSHRRVTENDSLRATCKLLLEACNKALDAGLTHTPYCDCHGCDPRCKAVVTTHFIEKAVKEANKPRG